MFYMHDGTVYNLAQFDCFYSGSGDTIVHLERRDGTDVDICCESDKEAKALVDDMWDACKPYAPIHTIENVTNKCEGK